MEVWADATARAVEIRKQYPDSQFADVYFNDYVSCPVGQMEKAYRHLGIEWTEAAEQGMSAWHRDHPQHKHGKHTHADTQPPAYSRAQIQERFAPYINACNVPVS
jgi:hypothetical protein